MGFHKQIGKNIMRYQVDEMFQNNECWILSKHRLVFKESDPVWKAFA